MNKTTVKTTSTLLASALMAAVAMAGSTSSAQAGENKTEKCYGVVKAGKNDCQTATSSCAGTSKVDGQGDAWILLPKGTCEKLVGGSTSPKK
ncbi:DUF2282 domain-containing protein [Emcibacter nanhaiensis]|uniref:DUF2282 domain-containing protein n=1 Tax=Emcibacter nanhaiensis TaxID=1505037 RepID=A0A501PQ47_9PROT|nr:DUF2282 domain-containing protein [Emcibacter nanhaiensis]TPD62660.1 DUF2282 domain-containing protein [Emcibacter nanhaiensis]